MGGHVADKFIGPGRLGCVVLPSSAELKAHGLTADTRIGTSKSSESSVPYADSRLWFEPD